MAMSPEEIAKAAEMLEVVNQAAPTPESFNPTPTSPETEEEKDESSATAGDQQQKKGTPAPALEEVSGSNYATGMYTSINNLTKSELLHDFNNAINNKILDAIGWVGDVVSNGPGYVGSAVSNGAGFLAEYLRSENLPKMQVPQNSAEETDPEQSNEMNNKEKQPATKEEGSGVEITMSPLSPSLPPGITPVAAPKPSPNNVPTPDMPAPSIIPPTP